MISFECFQLDVSDAIEITVVKRSAANEPNFKFITAKTVGALINNHKEAYRFNCHSTNDEGFMAPKVRAACYIDGDTNRTYLLSNS